MYRYACSQASPRDADCTGGAVRYAPRYATTPPTAPVPVDAAGAAGAAADAGAAALRVAAECVVYVARGGSGGFFLKENHLKVWMAL